MVRRGSWDFKGEVLCHIRRSTYNVRGYVCFLLGVIICLFCTNYRALKTFNTSSFFNISNIMNGVSKFLFSYLRIGMIECVYY